MQRTLYSDWLPERARWNDTARSGLPFCSRNKISPKSKRVHESFLLQNFFRDNKKISLSGWNKKRRKPKS